MKTKIGCAGYTYVLIAIVKKKLQLDVSLYTLLQTFSVSVLERTLNSIQEIPPFVVHSRQ